MALGYNKNHKNHDKMLDQLFLNKEDVQHCNKNDHYNKDF